jgi:hypothetical protein
MFKNKGNRHDVKSLYRGIFINAWYEKMLYIGNKHVLNAFNAVTCIMCKTSDDIYARNFMLYEVQSLFSEVCFLTKHSNTKKHKVRFCIVKKMQTLIPLV